MKYRSKNCKSCGGKMQYGGIGYPDDLLDENFNPINPPASTTIGLPDWLKQDLKRQEETPILPPGYREPTVDRVRTPRVPPGMVDIKLDTPYINNEYIPRVKEELSREEEKKRINPYFALRGLTTGAAWLSGMVERGRQRNYMMDQYMQLGQRDGMQVEDFQPNPFSMYAKYGGKLKKYIKDGC